jgi:hypothetical protein
MRIASLTSCVAFCVGLVHAEAIAPAAQRTPVAPAVHLVTHHTMRFGDHAERRSFVVFGDAPAIDDASWHMLPAAAYDATELAELAPAASPTTLTLLGTKGTRVVAADHRVALRHGAGVLATPRAALEVPADDDLGTVRVALVGAVQDAAWHELVYACYQAASNIAGTTLTVEREAGSYTVHDGARTVAHGEGFTVGVIDVGGDRYLVTMGADAHDAEVRLIGKP